MVAAFDEAVLSLVDAIGHPVADEGFRAITRLGDTLVLLAASALLVWWLVRKDRLRTARYVAASLLVGLVPFVQGLKMLVGRVRPDAAGALVDLPASASFPSGHAFGALLVAGLAAWAVHRVSPRAGAWFALVGGVLALLVGVSRVYLGVHWPSDVAAGWLLAGAWLVATVWIHRRWVPARPERSDGRE
jgi:undecaprenyl-diphosphatase